MSGNAAAARKTHVAVVGHLGGQQFFGGERSLLDLLAAIDRRQYEVSCILPNASDEYLRAAKEHTGNVIVLPYQWWHKTRPFDEEAVAGFEKLFRRECVDIVHVNTITLRDPLVAARRLKLPSIVHVRELIDRDTELAGTLGHDASAIVAMIRAEADFVIANSDTTHRLYRKKGRSFRLYNTVDPELFDLTNTFDKGGLKVGIISNNAPRKGIEQFVNMAIVASRWRPQLKFLVIGPRTEHAEELDRMARAEGGSVNLRFTGYIADPVEAMRQVNVVVSFSIFAESFGRTIAEGMAARRPIIAYRWGAAPELVRDGKDGFIVPYLGIAKALERLWWLSEHPELAAEMGRNGRARARQLFAPRVFAANLKRIYRQVVKACQAREPAL